LIPSRRLCRARSLKPEISGEAAWQARHISDHLKVSRDPLQPSFMINTVSIEPSGEGAINV
ncbi:hypothetical protein, partial [Agrobacterium tumefaciens]|uniref:hypothetical protein n=1 Tax=Agrobacterium tumefaciens TaxID=358 RepID=UPI001AEE2B7F